MEDSKLEIGGRRGDITLRGTARDLTAFEAEPWSRDDRRPRTTLENRLKQLPFDGDETDLLTAFHDVRTELGFED